ncbi:MAG: riboflavin synthase [Chitinophagaceae bacterium]|nr:riboflavin synthase [Chitinophagaceae bacterium]
MFTGIIEKTGFIEEVLSNGSNKTFLVSSPLFSQLKVDQSLSHDGVCLTIEELKNGLHQVTAISETLLKTNLGKWQKGSIINLERCMQLNGRLDGHFVQGHVDTTAVCIDIVNKDGSWEYSFRFPEKFSKLIIEKGSITVNGISLTIFNITAETFTVAIVPYTYEHTNMNKLIKGDLVNIEFDMIGKYVNRIQSLQ